MPTKTKKEITDELSEKVSQYQELDNMLESLRETIADCGNYAAADDFHIFLNGLDSDNVNYIPAEDQSKEILKKYGQALYNQIESFFEGPKDSDDSSVAEWVSRNYVAVRLFTSSDFMKHNSVEGLDFAEGSMHRAAQMAKMFLLKYLPKPESIYWGSDTHVPESEQNYNKYMADDFADLPARRKAYSAGHSLAWVKNKIASQVAVNPENAEISGLNAPETDSLAAFAKELKDAKTTFNSNEYKMIISFTENWASARKEFHGDTPKKDAAAQLVCLKSAINAYLNHKGKDGVKKNVYKKLAAVEKLNQYVSEKLKEISEVDLPSAETKALFRKIKEDLPKDDIAPTYKDGELIAQKVNTARLFGQNTDAAECDRTLRCMDKIICRSESRKRELKDIQKEFFENPGQEEYSIGKLAAEAMERGISNTSIGKSTRAFYENAIESNMEYMFHDYDELTYNYAKKNNLRVTLEVSWEEKEYSWKDAEAMTVSAAKRAQGGDRNWKGILRENITRINRAVEEHLLKPDVLDSESKFAAAAYNDKELIEKWPEIKLRLGCYKEAFENEAYVDEKISNIIEKYDQMEERMLKLAKPYLDKKRDNKLQKTDDELQNTVAEKQVSKDHSLI